MGKVFPVMFGSLTVAHKYKVHQVFYNVSKIFSPGEPCESVFFGPSFGSWHPWIWLIKVFIKLCCSIVITAITLSQRKTVEFLYFNLLLTVHT